MYVVYFRAYIVFGAVATFGRGALLSLAYFAAVFSSLRRFDHFCRVLLCPLSFAVPLSLHTFTDVRTCFLLFLCSLTLATFIPNGF